VSSFVVGDGDDYTEAKRQKHLCSCVGVPEAAVLAGFVCSFHLHPMIVRLDENRLLEAAVLAYLLI
jgi:hypothetical protein